MRTLVISLAMFSMLSSAAFGADDRVGDEKAILERLGQFKTAWNKEDTTAMASVWAEDGTLINPVGTFASGRDEIIKIFVDEHAHAFKATEYSIAKVKIQWLSPDVAIADVSAKLTGIKAPDGSAAPDYDHHVVWVFVKKDGGWLAAAARPYSFAKKPA